MTLTYSSILSSAPDWANDESTEYAAAIPSLLELAQDRCSDTFAELEQFKTTSSGSLVAGSATVSRPADAIFFRLFSITVSGATRILERASDVGTLLERFPTSTQAAPRYYAEDGASTLRLAPVPDSTYAYTIRYSRKLPYLSASVGNTTNWLTDYAPEALRYALMVETFLWKDYPDEVRMYLGAFGRAVNDIRKRHGLNERDDYRALASAFSTDNQGDYPVPMATRMKMQQGGGTE